MNQQQYSNPRNSGNPPTNPGGYYPPGGGAYYYHPGNFYSPVDPEAWRKQEEQKAYAKTVTRKAQWIGAGMLFVQAIGTLLVFLIPLLVDVFFPGASTSGSIYYDAIEYAVYSPLSIMLSFWIAAKATKQPLVDLIPFEKHSPGLSVGCILFAFLGVAIGNLVAGYVGILFPQIEENLEAASGALPTTPMELFIYVLYVAAIPALVEEFAFRGVVLGMLRPYGDKFAIVTSALLFALLHGNFIQIPFAFFLGLALGHALVRTGSILPAIMIHFINNAMSCVLTYYDDFFTNALGDIYVIGLYVIWFFLGIIGFVILRVGYGKMTTGYRSYDGCVSIGKRNASFYKAATIIISIVVYLLTSFMLMIPGLT